MHLLATDISSLDDVAVAVDVEQSPADVVFLSFSDSDLSALAHAWEQSAALPPMRLTSLKRLRHPLSVDLYADRVLAAAKVVVVRCLGGHDYWAYGFSRLSELARAHGVALVALPGDDRPDERLTALSTVSPEVVARFDVLMRAGGPGHMRTVLELAASLAAGAVVADGAEPQALAAALVLWPDGRVCAADCGCAPVRGAQGLQCRGEAEPVARRARQASPLH
jgi:cobaltochelatase CobN